MPLAPNTHASLLDEVQVDLPDGCWTIDRKPHPSGYVRVSFHDPTIGTRRIQRLHRIMYEFFIGNILEDLVLDHLCRNRTCCNPDHLEAVSQKENVRRGRNFQREKTHCPRGHEYSIENTRMYDGRRYCRACHRIHGANHYYRKQEQGWTSKTATQSTGTTGTTGSSTSAPAPTSRGKGKGKGKAKASAP